MSAHLVARARELAEERLVGLPRRWAHVQGVASTASAVASILAPPKVPVVVAAAWLHDVGYAHDLAVTGFHPVDGARFARARGMPELVVTLIAHHSGAEVEAEERGLSEDLARFPRPPEPLLDLLTFADMTTSPDGTPVSAEDRLSEILHRYREGDPVFAAVSRSRPLLLAAVQRVSDRLNRPETPSKEA